eukprot:Hpha_TRINITY_DN16452_c0_g5::TRINITY_DN16452_c0_g5_i1::g.161336::m.161336
MRERGGGAVLALAALLVTEVRAQAAKNFVNNLNTGGGTKLTGSTFIVSYTTDYAAAASATRDGQKYPSVLLGDGGVLGTGRVLAFGKLDYAVGDGMDGTLKTKLFTDWAFRGKGAPKVVVDLDWNAADVKTHLQGLGATVSGDGLQAYSTAAGLKAKLQADGIDALVLTFRGGQGSAPYPTDGYEAAILDWLKSGGSVIAAGQTTSWTWNYHSGSYRQDTCRRFPGNKIFETVGMLWYCNGYTFGYDSEWNKIVDESSLVLSAALGALAAETPTSVLTASVPGTLSIQLNVLLVCSPCSGTDAVCTDVAVYNDIWQKGNDVVTGPCEPTYNGPFPLKKDDGWKTCTDVLSNIFNNFPDGKQPGAALATTAKRYPGGHFDLLPAKRKATVTQEIKPYLRGWHCTGWYAPPGVQVEMEIPTKYIGKITQMLIGVHSDSFWKRDEWLRFPNGITKKRNFDSNGKVKMVSVWGGPVWVWVDWSLPETEGATYLTRTSDVILTLKNVHRMLWYEHGVTTEADWDMQLAEADAPWADMQCRTETYSIPFRSVNENWDYLYKVCEFYWDRTIGLGENEMVGQGGYWDTRTEIAVFDVQTSIGYMHSGYWWAGPVSGDANTPGSVRWDGATNAFSNLWSGNWGDLHEMGHNHDCCAWSHRAADVHTNAWVCQGYHESPQYITRCQSFSRGGQMDRYGFLTTTGGPCTYDPTETNNGVPANACDLGLMLKMHTTIMSQLGFGIYKKHLRRGNHLKRTSADGGFWYDEQGTRFNYALAAQTQRNCYSLYWSFSYNPIPNLEYRNAVLLDKPLTYIRFGDTEATDTTVQLYENKADAARTRPAREGPGSTKTTFVSTAVMGQPSPHARVGGKGASFDGTQSVVASLENEIACDGAGGVEAWVKLDSISAGTILQKQQAGGAALWKVVVTAAGKVALDVGGAVVDAGSPALQTGKWTHVAVTWAEHGIVPSATGHSVVVYIDAVRYGPKALATLPGASTDFEYNIGEGLKGSLADMSVYCTSITPDMTGLHYHGLDYFPAWGPTGLRPDKWVQGDAPDCAEDPAMYVACHHAVSAMPGYAGVCEYCARRNCPGILQRPEISCLSVCDEPTTTESHAGGCTPNLCKNGGTCTVETPRPGLPDGSYSCACPGGFSGHNCELGTPSAGTGTPTATSTHKQTGGTPFAWVLKAGADVVGDGIKCDSNLWDCPDHLGGWQGGQSVMKPSLGQKVDFTFDGRSRSWEWKPLNVAAGVFPDDQTSTAGDRDRIVYYHSFALYVPTDQEVNFQFETTEGVRIWIGGKLCKDEKWGTSGGLNEFSCGLVAGWSQVIVKAREQFKLQPKADITWSLQLPASGSSEEKFFRVPHPKRSVYPTWWTSSAAGKAAGLKITFDYPRYMWWGDGEMLTPKGKIAPVGQCGTDKNGLGGAADGFELELETTFTTTAGIADGASSFDVCFWHPFCQQWRKVGAALEAGGAAAACGSPPACWSDAGGCKWTQVPDGDTCGGGICMAGTCANVNVVTATCPAGNPDCKLRKDLSVATAYTGGALVQDVDDRFEPWGANGLPHAPSPIFSSTGAGGFMVAWTVNDVTYTRMHQLGKLGVHTIRVSFFDEEMKRRTGKPDIHIAGGSVTGFTAADDGRFALLRWSTPNLYAERYDPDGTQRWSVKIDSKMSSMKVGDSRIASLPQGGEDYYAMYHHSEKEGDHYAEVDAWGVKRTDVRNWCNPSYRHELAVHKDLNEIITVCVGEGIRIKTHKASKIDKVIHDIPSRAGWGRAAGDISTPVAVADGFWLAISAAKTATTTFNRADKMQLGLVHIKWEANTWQVQPIVWPTAGDAHEVAPRLWPFGKPGESEYLLMGWQREEQGAGHQSSMQGDEKYYIAMYNYDVSKGEVGVLKDDADKEVIEEITDTAVWSVHAPGLLNWRGDTQDGSAGWVYSWKPGVAEKWKYTDGGGCEFGGDAVCDGGIPPVRNEPRKTPSQPGEPYLQLVRVKPPDFNCTDTEKKLCQNETSCEKRFGKVTCQCPLGHANAAGVPKEQWGYVAKCEDMTCALNPTNCGTNATCRDIHHPTKPFTCECPPSHPIGNPDDHCHVIARGDACSAQPGEPLKWGPITNLAHFGTPTTNIGGGIGKNDHFAADDSTLEPRIGEAGPGSAVWTPEIRDDGQWGRLTGSNWYTTAFSLALYSPVVQQIRLQVSHDIGARIWFGRGWKFAAPVLWNNGTANTDVPITLDFTVAGWWWLFIKFYDDFNYRNLQLSIPQPVAAPTEWPMLAWCYDLPLIDECTDKLDDCAPSATCTDTAKYFECKCPPGKAGEPPSGFNGDPSVKCVPVEGEPLGKGYVTKLLHYGSSTYNLGGGVDSEKFAKKQAEMTPVTGDTGPTAGEVWTRVERPDGNLPYGGNWHSDALSLALWSPEDQTVDVGVETAAGNNAKARIYLEGNLIFDASTSATVGFPVKKGWNQVFIRYYVDFNTRVLKLDFPWNTLGWWYEKPLINECANDTLNDCVPDANCLDTVSGYECHCKVGFAGDGIKECLKIEGEPLVDGLVKKTLRYQKKTDPASSIGGGLDSTHFDACCGGDIKLRPLTEEEPGAISNEWWWGKWVAPEYNGVAGNLVTTGQPNWYTDIFSWAVYSPKDQEVDLIVYTSKVSSRVWVDNALVNEATKETKSTKVTLTKGWHQVVGKFYADFNGRTFTVTFNASNLGWAYDIPRINECQLPDKGNCHADAICVDTPASYYCECKNGFAGDGTTSCVAIEGQQLGCGKITKVLKYGDESFNHGGGIDVDKFDGAGLGKQNELRPKTGDAGFDAAQVWTQVERADGNLPYGGNWHADLFALAVYSPADGTEVTIGTSCSGTNSQCRLWNDGVAVISVAGGGAAEFKVTLSKGWHQWIMKYYVDYNARTYFVDIKSPCTLGWAYEIPDNDKKCLVTVCKSQGQCLEDGECTDNTTGVCSSPPKTDGAACDDGNTSTIDDACKAGVCEGKDLCAGKDCSTPPGECQEPGTCNPATGLCAFQTMIDGASCDDGVSTTVDDKCVNGTCSGVDRCTGVTCTEKSTCHEVGICDHNTGFCSDPVRPDGALCNDSLVNTVEDVCTAGICKGVDKCLGSFCKQPPACHGDGGCDVKTGLCVYPTLPNDTFCDDGNPATIDDICTNGFCAGKSPDEALCPSSCTLPTQCAEPPTCEGPGMVCTYKDKPNGFPCDDGDTNTGDDRCFQGQCLGSDKCVNVICNDPGNACMEKGVCDPTTGTCASLPRPDGAACDDGDPATADDQCKAGVCGGKDLCATPCATKACHDAGVCDPANGICAYNPQADLTVCDSNGAAGECISATCQPKDFCRGVTCTAKDDCHDAGTCDRTNGTCSDIRRPDGVTCQTTGTCTAGICSMPPPTVSPSMTPTTAPSTPPSASPQKAPTVSPSAAPSSSPSTSPTAPPLGPTNSPLRPSAPPSAAPSKPPLKPESPTQSPVVPPTASPSVPPSMPPSAAPLSPSVSPLGPTASPLAPSTSPSMVPSKPPLKPDSPTQSPVVPPTNSPSEAPSASPAQGPSQSPSSSPIAPSKSPLKADAPTQSPVVPPTASPSASPIKGASPTQSPVAGVSPTVSPSASPVTAVSPTGSPVVAGAPSKSPAAPSGSPSASPVNAPTKSPLAPDAPTTSPVVPPTVSPSGSPSKAPQSPTAGPSGSPIARGSPTAAPITDFNECVELKDPCGSDKFASGQSAQTCTDPNPTRNGVGDFICTCTNGAKNADGTPLSEVNGPAICRNNECDPVNPCGDDQDCYDPDTTADRKFDYTCTCREPARGSGGIKSWRVGTRARCEVDECAATTPCGEGEICEDINMTAASSSQSKNASGFFDFTCSCKDGSRQVTGGPANCSDNDACAAGPCGDGQTCTNTADGGFRCNCEAPNFGTAVGKAAVCEFDECHVGSLKMCGAGQACHDDDTLKLGTFNCTCLPPYNGSKIGGPANCWHDDCQDNPCSEEQYCVDEGPGFGTYHCVCKGGYKATNRAAACVYDECVEREEAKKCFQCFDPHDSPVSVSDYRCFCNVEGDVRVGSPCTVFSAADLEGPADKVDEGSDWFLVILISLITAAVACIGAALLVVRRRRKTKFAEIAHAATAAYGDQSLQELTATSSRAYKQMDIVTPAEGPMAMGSSIGEVVTPRRGSSDERTRGFSAYSRGSGLDERTRGLSQHSAVSRDSRSPRSPGQSRAPNINRSVQQAGQEVCRV